MMVKESSGTKNSLIVKGVVVKNAMDKTAIVEVKFRKIHKLYKKSYQTKSRYFVHDPENKCNIDDIVYIRYHRPISKNKNWVVDSFVEDANEE